MFYYLQKVRLWRYIVYKIDDETSNSVLIEQRGLREETFENMVGAIPDRCPRWVIMDLEYEDSRQGKTLKMNKIVFIVYNPDDAAPDQRAQKVQIQF